MPGMPIACYRALALGLKFMDREVGTWRDPDRVIIGRPTTQLLFPTPSPL